MKMKKHIIVCSLLTLSIGLMWAQVTLNNRSGTLLTTGTAMYIDPLGNTSGSGGIQEDVVISSNGYVGIGRATSTIVPSVRLQVQGTLRIADGTQSQGAFLVSDADGVGTWYGSDLIGRRVVWGGVVATKLLTATYQDITSVPLDLTGGLWMIVAKADIAGTVSNSTLTTAGYVWIKIVEEITDAVGSKIYTDISEGGLPYSIRKGVYQKYYSTPMVQGFISIPVEGVRQKKRKYYVQIKSPSTSTFSNPQLTSDLTGAYFYAIKLQ